MALTKLTKADTKQGVVDWLNSHKKDFESKPQDTRLHVANELMDKLFRGNETDALKPYATAVDKTTKGNPKKYPSLVMSHSEPVEGKKTKEKIVYPEWKEADKDFTDAKEGKYYFPTLVHLGGILKWDDAPNSLTFSHQWILAQAITKKLVRIPDPEKDRIEDAVYLDDFASDIEKLPETELGTALTNRQNEQKKQKELSRNATLKAKEEKERKEQKQAVVVSATETKALKALHKKLKDIERDVDKMTTGIKDALRELGWEIGGTIKAIEMEKKK